jgi:hypothetical protein
MKHRGKNSFLKNEQSMNEFWSSIKQPKISIICGPEREEKNIRGGQREKHFRK